MAFAFPVTFAAGAMRAVPGIMRGYVISETAGAVAKVRLWDNASAASGTKVAVITLVANGTASLVIPDGIRLINGLFTEVVSGAVDGSVYF